MSYDLMVFDPAAAPTDRTAFLAWYADQTKWAEGHSYDDPAVSAPALAAWYADLIQTYPPMNGPLASADPDNPKVSDYSIGKAVIYVAFGWSQAEAAGVAMYRTAVKHHVGFFDVSADDGLIWYPPQVSDSGMKGWLKGVWPGRRR